MKTPKKVIEKISLALMFVMFVMAVLMFAVSPVSAAPVTCDPNFCDQDGDDYYRVHKRCPADCGDSEGIDCDDSNPSAPADPLACETPGSTPDPTTLTPCEKYLCLASVDKWDRPAARSYVEDTFGDDGSYTKIPPKVFGDILAGLPEDDFCKLYDAYNVLVFQWKSPGIKNLTWQSLVNYMACGGGVVFEDPSNVDALEEFDENDVNIGVATTNIYIRSNSTPPITIAFNSEDCQILAPTLCGPLQLLPTDPTSEFDVENNHMEFDSDQPSEDPSLHPFLRLLPGEQIIGLYGKHSEGGRIVITGPDNSFHGNDFLGEFDPHREAHYNQYHLLSREINWLLLGGPAE